MIEKMSNMSAFPCWSLRQTGYTASKMFLIWHRLAASNSWYWSSAQKYCVFNRSVSVFYFIFSSCFQVTRHSDAPFKERCICLDHNYQTFIQLPLFLKKQLSLWKTQHTSIYELDFIKASHHSKKITLQSQVDFICYTEWWCKKEVIYWLWGRQTVK